MGLVWSRRLYRPLANLVEASKKVSRGELSAEVGPRPKGDIANLHDTFIVMQESLRERTGDSRRKAK